MILRNDLKPSSAVVPQGLKDTLLRLGGTNIYDEPLFRVCLAEDRIELAAGNWDIWPDDMPVEERGGLGIQQAQKMLLENRQQLERLAEAGCSLEAMEMVARRQNAEMAEFFNSGMGVHPLATISGMIEKNVYGDLKGWILEIWKPAHAAGTREEWESYRFQGEPALGPYPIHGYYDLIAGPTPYQPTASQVEDAIRRYFRELQDKPASPLTRVNLMFQRMEEARQRKERELRDRIEAMVSDGPCSLRNRLSLGAGRVMTELAEKAGIRSHMGN